VDFVHLWADLKKADADFMVGWADFLCSPDIQSYGNEKTARKERFENSKLQPKFPSET
jgi:hypothetical protein